MLLSSKLFLYTNTITHEGKLVVFGVNTDAEIWYTVKQDGFEDTYLNPPKDQPRTGWEDWKRLELPDEPTDDTSVTEKEQKELTYQNDPNKYLLRSRYKTSDQTAATPVQLVSGMGHLYVFRQSKSNTLYVDRFVLDGMTNTLTRKLEVRYKRSRKRYEASGNQKSSDNNTLLKIDSLDFRDINDNLFYEPTTELCLVENLRDGEFSVVLLPTNEQDKYRWHIFAYNTGTQKVEITSLRASENGLFEVQDYTVSDPVMRSIPGIIKRILDFNDVAFVRGLSAARYDVQKEQQTDVGKQMLRDAIRVMLVYVTNKDNVAALSLAVALDGTLSQIAETPSPKILRASSQQVLLPINSLDDIVVRMDTSVVQGNIKAINQGEDGEAIFALDTPTTSGLKSSQTLKISSNADYNQVYSSIKKIDDDTFEITPAASILGKWEIVPETPNVLYDGIITGYQLVDGKLKITALKHGLEDNDTVQIADTRNYNGVYTVKAVNAEGVSLENTRWQTGAALNIKKLTNQRQHAMVFDGVDDYVQLPAMTIDFSKGFTAEAWVCFDTLKQWSRIIDFGNGQGIDNIVLSVSDNTDELRFFIDAQDSSLDLIISAKDALIQNEWMHLAATVDSSGKGTLYKNGVEIVTQTSTQSLPTINRTSNFIGKSNWTNDELFDGQMAEVRIWNKARSANEIQNSMYLPLTGQETGLCGYWRLGGIVDGKTPDFSGRGNDGTVSGGAYISGRRLPRFLWAPSSATLENQPLTKPIQATQYTNDELFAVTAGATYTEEFEFRLYYAQTPPTISTADLFDIVWRGKKTRNSSDWIEITATSATTITPIGDNWYKASAAFLVPNEVSLVRQFGIEKVTGTWSELEIRKQTITLTSDTITQAVYADNAALTVLPDTMSSQKTILKTIAQTELQQALLEIEKRKLTIDIEARTDVKTLTAQINSKNAELATEKTNLEKLKTDRDAWNNQLQYSKNQVTVYWNKDCQGASLKFGIDKKIIDLRRHINSGNNKNWNNEICSLDVPTGLKITLYEHEFIDGDLGENIAFTAKIANLGDYKLKKRRTSWYNEAGSLQVTTEKGFTDAKEIEKNLQESQFKFDACTKKLAVISQEIAALEADRVNLVQSTTILKNRLAQVSGDLTKIQIPSISNYPIGSVQSMSVLKTYKGLRTQGALLDFVRPVGRLQALETCEGNVQLSYFDDWGRMRQTNFDATTDSANAAFEQWIPDMVARPCLNFSAGQGMTLTNPIDLEEEWTVETWFSYPLPDNKEFWPLFWGTDTDNQVIVKKNPATEMLGIYLHNNGDFLSSQFDMKALSPGWHHLAVVANKDGTTFYIDARNVGNVKKKSTSNICKIGDFSSNKDQPFGKLAEVRIWNVGLSSEEIIANSKTTLTGAEPGLAAYFPMTEGNGTTVTDKSGNQHDGTLIGNPAWVPCTAPIGNLGHRVMELDGENDYIQLPTMPKSIDFSKGITVEAWVRYDEFQAWSRIIELGNGEGKDNIILANKEGTNTLIFQIWRDNKWSEISAQNALTTGEWQHLAVAVDDSGKAMLYKNGIALLSSQPTLQLPASVDRTSNFIGESNWKTDRFLDAQMSDVRLWNKARSADEIKNSRYERLTGSEAGLVGYWRLNSIKVEGSGDQKVTKVTDDSGNGRDGTIKGFASFVDSNTLPIGGETLTSAEYSTIVIDPRTKQKISIMRRFFVTPATGGVQLIADKRVEALELVWIGNGQFAPTLLGYIEGPPPVPSENLTIEENYNGATSVELSLSDDMEFSWHRSDDVGVGLNGETFIGVDMEVTAGIGMQKKLLETRQGLVGNMDVSYQFQNESNITAASTQVMGDKLELCGTRETDAKFPHLGRRFIPKNVGYALVVSALADMFISRLARTKRMVGYQVLPLKGVEPDINTITFLINPAYTMSGSLDGLTGSSATSQRFFKHVPAMRAQYGSLYPASYYRLLEAYDLKGQIEKRDKDREAYFAQFNARLLDVPSLERETDAGSAPTEVGVNREEGKPDTALSDAERQARMKTDTEIAQAETDTQKSKVTEKNKAIQQKIDDADARAHARTSFSDWQKKMENIQIRAGKRNIVNTYVWDADGGLRTEAQSFASTAEHSIGGSFILNAALGGQGAFNVLGAGVELTFQVTTNLTQTMSKTQRISRGVQLNVDLSEVEARGITNYNDLPIQPGEKVDRYRFMSFYLEGSTNNFVDFFNYVVDPEWLASNDEEARALRQARRQPNKAWRVLHRVTYVERPALMGFGRDLRSLSAAQGITVESDLSSMRDRIKLLQKENKEIKELLNSILTKIGSK